MAGGPSPTMREPANEQALIDQTLRAARRLYGPRIWTLQTTRASAGHRGLPDRLICFDGHFLAWEFKNPRRPEPPTPRQRQELDAITRAGGHAATITSVRQALDILETLSP